MRIEAVAEKNDFYTVTFEVVKEYDFHEKPVAVQALCSLVRSQEDLEQYTPHPGVLAVNLNALKHQSDEDVSEGNPKGLKPVDVELELNAIRLLGLGLHDFINTSPLDIHVYSSAGNLYGCAVRSVETLMAKSMADTVKNLSPVALQQVKPTVGFSNR